MKVFAIGASRNVGYYTALGLLKASENNNVVFFLRNLSVFDEDADIQPFIKSGHAKLVKGDALNEDDLKNAFAQATSDGIPIDVVIFSLGGPPSFSITKGFVVSPPNLCSTGLFNTLATFPRQEPQPRLVVLTAFGVTRTEHAYLPLVMRPIYAMIKLPHADKLGMEKLIHYSAGWKEDWNEDGPADGLLPNGWENRLGHGWLKSVVIVRPPVFSEGEGKGKYRAGTDLKSVWMVNRKDVARFIVTDLLQDWSKYDGKAIVVAN